LPGAPAIANAVAHAIGVRILDLPITPEKVLRALKAQQNHAPGQSHA
jgi:CO/xanthine dehydrogenase Mo-binding subunit